MIYQNNIQIDIFGKDQMCQIILKYYHQRMKRYKKIMFECDSEDILK